MCQFKRGETFEKPCFIGTQRSQNLNIENKVLKTKINKTKVVIGASFSRKRGGLYNTYHELQSEKRIVKSSRRTRRKVTTSYQVGLTTYSKTSLAKNSDNILYKTQKHCNKNSSLKSQTRFRLRGSLKADQYQLP